jgi:hypothetical protein
MRTVTAIKIDVINQDVYPVQIVPNKLDDIYEQLACDIFTCPLTFDNNDSLFVDDEGLFVEPSTLLGAFYIEGFPSQPLFGHGLIVGVDDEGETDEVLSTVEEIKKKVTFLNDEAAEYELLKYRDIPPTFLTF